ncbi:DMT family transporter [Alkalihalophilus marmarensis]|jgi:drug/metabolite transporter (DMT)-like permease|uniref:EamA domain-containing protein n=1 Tax=Alkalihalophilus marmarensis DSM 21297 TaxID=1188261 RepID=U6SQR0_9BACI|nr:DMT family transporter [Alkalihalophilus marmarensis]ERN53933.1 hypothetical protein A33I_09015 [Alkalihalophilus marmarensis DSM 21297]MCM3491104.1 DMT family transporter [Alkalihalophilus marmarensis]
MNYKVFLAYSIAVVLWASAFPGIRVGLEHYSPQHLSLLRLLIGSIGLILFALIARIKLPKLKDVPVILLLGFLGFSVYHTALSIGEQSVSAGAAALLVSTTPIFSALLALMFLRERMGKFGWSGSFIAFLGVAIIMLGTGDTLSLQLGALIILIGALGESFYFVFQSKYLKSYGFLPFTIYTIVSGTIFMLFFSPGLTLAISAAPLDITLTVIYLGLLPTVIPYFCIAYVTSKVGASEATSVLYLTPAIAIFISWVWLGEIPTFLTILGGIITLLGVTVTSLQSKQITEQVPDKSYIV